jgi:peptide chain release factor
MISWLQITSGRGPDECCWVVYQLARHVLHETATQGIDAKIIGRIAGDKPETYKSVLISLDGDAPAGFLKSLQGTVQWIGKSMFRRNHKRKNWFVGVSVFSPPKAPEWSTNEIRIDRMRSSGPGGQHVNKTESAVRLTHIPTGITVMAQEERSQHRNRKLAMSRLNALLRQKENAVERDSNTSRWDHHNRLERGNPVRVYEGVDFRLKKVTLPKF